MVTTTRNFDELDAEDAVSFRHLEGPAKTWDVSSRTRQAAQSRYGRRKGAASFNGAHRRRNKRNYI